MNKKIKKFFDKNRALDLIYISTYTYVKTLRLNMKKLLLIVVSAMFIFSGAFAGEKAAKAGEVAGKAAKETKEAGIVVIDATKKGAKTTMQWFKDLFKSSKENGKDFKEGVKKGYEGE